MTIPLADPPPNPPPRAGDFRNTSVLCFIVLVYPFLAPEGRGHVTTVHSKKQRYKIIRNPKSESRIIFNHYIVKIKIEQYP